MLREARLGELVERDCLMRFDTDREEFAQPTEDRFQRHRVEMLDPRAPRGGARESVAMRFDVEFPHGVDLDPAAANEAHRVISEDLAAIFGPEVRAMLNGRCRAA